jgi:chromosome segregation ATPase
VTTTDTTTTTTARNAAMAEGRRADSARRRQRVLNAIHDATHAGDEISVSGIARRAGVDRTFLYRHRDLLEQLHAAEAQPATAAAGPTVSRASLQTDLLNAQQRTTRLAAHIQQLERRLSETLGEQAWRESGLGTPDDVDQLKQHITMLEQQTADLRLQLDERDQDLQAARAANRELMTQLNTPRHAR